jgi:cell division transport system permease protein
MIRFYFSEAQRIVKRSPWATITIISVTTLAVLLGCFSYYVILFTNKFSDRIKNNINIIAYLDETVDSRGVSNIKDKLFENSNIANIKYVSKEEALKGFIEETGEDIRKILDVNPLPRSFVIKLKPEKVTDHNIRMVTNEIKNMSGINDVVLDNDWVFNILRYLKSGQVLIYILSVLLFLLSIYLVYTNSRTQFESNINLYKSMKLVGAKSSTLKAPIIIYGLSVGLIAGIVNILFHLIVQHILLGMNVSKNNFVFMFQNSVFLLPFLLGIFLGFIGSYVFIRKILI